MVKAKKNTKTTIINLKGIPKELGNEFKRACRRGKITMTHALKYYMEGVVSLEGGLGSDVNALLPSKGSGEARETERELSEEKVEGK